jgi:hypothetical protein
MEERAGERRRFCPVGEPPLSSVLSLLLRRGERKKTNAPAKSSCSARISGDTDREKVRARC